MRITFVSIPKNHPSDMGLDDIKMSNLGKIVLVAGKNGSGKTRLLQTIKRTLQNQQKPMGLMPLLKFQKESKSNIEKQADGNYIAHLFDASNEVKIKFGPNLENMDIYMLNQYMHTYIPKNLSLTNPFELTQNNIKNASQGVEKIGLGDIAFNTLAKIQQTHNVYHLATNPNLDYLTENKGKIIPEYEALKTIIEKMLGTKLSINDEYNATLFNKDLGEEHLSDGQKVLLQIAIAILCQGSQLDECILVLDEPENHLHPSAIIEVIDALKDSIKNGQIWIATHSVSILAHFSDKGSLWYMEDGKISNAGKIQDKVLRGLLGDSECIDRQMDFLTMPDQVAMLRYTSQCLLPPTTVITEAGDPQSTQIRNVINELYRKNQKLKLLDYGAGKGRLLSNLADDCSENKCPIENIDYVAFDEFESDEDACKAIIQRVYGDCSSRWFCKRTELRVPHNNATFDIVVLCNVLHEIDPLEWKKLFGESGSITEFLKDDGHLLIVEDQHLRIGEHAHQFGFIVLDTPALKDLFGISGNDTIKVDSQREGRLKAHLIPKAYLSRFTKGSLEKALQEHLRQAKEEMTRLRKNKQNDYETGRKLAFWTHQYTNASLALDAISG